MTEQLTPLKRALIQLDQMHARLDAAERARRQPIAIVGIGCRFPGGVDDPNGLWQLLVDGRDAIVDVPADRWDVDALYHPDPDHPGTMSTRQGGFLGDVSGFEAEFFGISPREARSMDPQQRLLLEVAWETLEHAGIAADAVRGTRTGVFVGATTADYAQLQLRATGLAGLDQYFTSGTAHSIASGRLSYVLGLEGPSVTLDTACSSSLVAVHLAVQSLRMGESDLALAGGVNLMLSPENSIMLSKFHMMAADDRCKPFDAGADGFVRAEGCALVALKRLPDALAAGDRVLAVIRGSAANQDGASSGLTAPNGPSQQSVIRAALTDAGVAPRDVTYVEAHGTGTALGDPIEVQALAAVLGTDRASGDPVVVGSVKANLGHLEAVAGVAGLIKAVLVLQHGEAPPQIHLTRPNPLIDWDELPIAIPVDGTSLPTDRPLIAGVSAFGFSGTNVHMVLEAAPEPPVPADGTAEPAVLVLSARTETALAALAGEYADLLERNTHHALIDVCATANVGRARLRHRLAVDASDRLRLVDGLRSVAAGATGGGVRRSEVTSADPPRIAFTYTGQGAQHHGMAAGLRASHATFREPFDDVVARFDREFAAAGVAPQLSAVLAGDADAGTASLLDRTGYAQAALFALEWGLTQHWGAWGVRPSALIGHSLGELVAAAVADVMSLDDAVRLVAARGRLMQQLPAGGAMLAVLAPVAEVEAVVADARQSGSVLAIAAVNGPAHVVVSGASADVDRIRAHFLDGGVRVNELRVSHAFHSPLMDPMIEEFREVARSIQLRRPRIRMVSNVTGAVVDHDVTDPEYWVRHVLAPVRFADGVAALLALDVDVFVEIGPHPVLTGLGQGCVEPGVGTWVGSLHRERRDHVELLDATARLDLAGVRVDWSAVLGSAARRRVALPTYPFERDRYWVSARRHRTAAATSDHPLLGRRLSSPFRAVTFENELIASDFDFIDDHRVNGVAIVPATGLVELAVAAASAAGVGGDLADLVIHDALVVPDDDVVIVQTIVDPGEATTFQVHSRLDGRDEWRQHASGRIVAPDRQLASRVDLVTGRDEVEPITGADHDARLARRGLAFGPSLRTVREVWVTAVGRAMATIGLVPDAAVDRYAVHPALLDAALQVVVDVLEGDGDAFLPLGIDRVSLAAEEPFGDRDAWATVAVRSPRDHADRSETIVADVVLARADGAVVVRLDGVRLKRADHAALARLGGADPLHDWFYEVSWQPIEATTIDEPVAPDGTAAAAATIADAVTPLADQLRREHRIDHYQGLIDELEALSVDYVLAALGQLGVSLIAGESFSVEQLGVVERHRRLIDHLLGRLAERGLVRWDATGWRIERTVTPDTSAARAASLIGRYPGGIGEITVTRRCGDRLAEALTGRADPLELLFPGGSIEAAEQMYQTSPFANFYNSLAGEAVAAAVPSRVGTGPVRVLEIGAGTGGTTAFVLPRLPPDARYTFTDVSPHFLSRARSKFVGRHGVDYRILDIEGDLDTQGLGDQRYDIVVAANVLHATADLRHTFANVARLLSPGGVLIMTEMVVPQTFISISFGLTDGWWRFEDTDLRPDSLLLDRRRWQAFLDHNGFDGSQVLPRHDDGAPEATRIQAVLVATRDAGTTARPTPSWLVIGDGPLGGELAAALRRADRDVVVAHPGRRFGGIADHACDVDLADPEDVDRMLASLRQVDRVVDVTFDRFATGSVTERTRPGLGGAVGLVQALLRRSDPPAITFVTRGAQPVGGDGHVSDPAGALVWGFARAVRMEHPELQARCVDVDRDTSAARLAAVLAHRADDEVAMRADDAFAARLVRSGSAVQGGSFEIGTRVPGALDGLRRRSLERRPPGPGEIEIDVRATALNFKDVLNVLGMYPGDPGPLGGECAGVVSKVGEGVTSIAVGDRVVALARGAFRSHAVCDATSVAPLPPGCSFAEGAALPIAAITAEYALSHVGRLRAGERVLVHAAAGGVGLAAVALARRIGAEVFATAGSDAKRDHLRSLGITHVYDSRSVAFADDIRRDTDGEGVDVVLNSLIGEAVQAGIGVLRGRGRFIEIGKRGQLSAEQVDRLTEIEYHVVDWTGDVRDDVELIRGMLLRAVGAGTSAPVMVPPVTTFPMERVADAFRHMAAARHIGKVVVVQPGWSSSAVVPDGTYLVTGGLGGLGLVTANHLVARGARSLALLGRREPDAAATAAIEAMRAAGAHIAVLTADVADRAALDAALTDVRSSMAPLRGIVHAAGALDDAGVSRLTWEQFETVLRAKCDGTELLMELTVADRVDMFVMYGSIVSVLGGRGQANHAAANAYLDAAAQSLAGAGRSALSIGWGAWSEVGAAADRGVDRHIAERGLGAIDPADGLTALDRLLDATTSPAVAVSPIDWRILLEAFGDPIPSLFADVAPLPAVGSPGARRAVASQVDLAALLGAATTARRPEIALDYTREQVARVLGMPVARIDDHAPLSDLGLDSLMAVELRNLIGTALGPNASVPATLAYDHPTVSDLAAYVLEVAVEAPAGGDGAAHAVPRSAQTEPGAPRGAGASLLDQLDRLEHLSDDEIEAELARRSGR